MLCGSAVKKEGVCLGSRPVPADMYSSVIRVLTVALVQVVIFFSSGVTFLVMGWGALSEGA
jgi:hypothetical protein